MGGYQCFRVAVWLISCGQGWWVHHCELRIGRIGIKKLYAILQKTLRTGGVKLEGRDLDSINLRVSLKDYQAVKAGLGACCDRRQGEKRMMYQVGANKADRWKAVCIATQNRCLYRIVHGRMKEDFSCPSLPTTENRALFLEHSSDRYNPQLLGSSIRPLMLAMNE